MNAAAQILTDLTVLGVRVRPDGGQLKLKPKSKLDSDTLATIKAHKAELLELCQRCEDCRRAEAVGIVTLICGSCGWCHPKVQILHALDRRRLTSKQIAHQTGLATDRVY